MASISIALDLRTGRSVTDLGQRRTGQPEDTGSDRWRPTYLSRGGPHVCGDVVMAGGYMRDAPARKEQPPGNVQAFDVRTGQPRWQFRVIPRPGEVGNETWENDSWAYSGAANLWSLISADEEAGLAYFPLSSPTNDMYGGHRLGNNLFGNTLVCVKCATGERVWHYQIVHHDLWDYDLPAAPILADITVGGRAIKAVVQLTKHGVRVRLRSARPDNRCGRSRSGPSRPRTRPASARRRRSRFRPSRRPSSGRACRSTI